MTQNQEVNTRLKGEVSIIDIRGEVTAASGRPIEEAYLGLTAAGAQKLLFVFSADCYINSGGIAVLIGILAECKKKVQVVRMTGLTPHFQKVFSMVGLTKYAPIDASEDMAIDRLKGHP
jgi:anti-anti-sigma factor